ncbi:MAG: FmdB family zinc ribbon protein [Thermosulfidibacteraceae bacterium]|jgi:putative FmdB family regulatory protein
MPIYEYICKECNLILEIITGYNSPPLTCPKCRKEMQKKPSTFSMGKNRMEERVKNVLELTKSYLKDGKVEDAKKLLHKAKEYIKNDTINRVYDKLSQKTEG